MVALLESGANCIVDTRKPAGYTPAGLISGHLGNCISETSRIFIEHYMDAARTAPAEGHRAGVSERVMPKQGMRWMPWRQSR